jgi:DNA-binding NtrC family response regulator
MMRARLTVSGGIASPQVYELHEGAVVNLGRNRDNTVVLHDRHASRWHAKVYASNGRWLICDQNTTNGTRINGETIDHERELLDGQEIAIGDVRLRFSLDAATTAEMPCATALLGADANGTAKPRLGPAAGTPDEPHVVAAAPQEARGSADGDTSPTVLHHDELTALFRFTNESLNEDTPQRLVTLALEVVRRQTRADLAGFLSLDDEPDFKVVLPEQAAVDRQLSRLLTQTALREGRCIWRRPDSDCSESLAHFHDAVCVPLRLGPALGPGARPAGPPGLAGTEKGGPGPFLGALHVYKSLQPFSEREVRFCQVLAGSLASTLHVLRARRALEADNSRLRVRAASPGDALLGDGPAMQQVREQIRRLADRPCNVLIVGESGVGKELVALGLHRQSRRHNEPLVPVNCAAICATLPESQLFGHCKGAFTGATRDHPGFFLQADMGTLFLDEVGELPLDIQAKLLRALETKKFTPVGARTEAKADVRILAATNLDLEREVREGKFRPDLFYRLKTTCIRVPPLREHPEDIDVLADHFLDRLNAEYKQRVTLAPATRDSLRRYSWPGNVRQLRSVLEAVVAMAGDHAVIQPADLHLDPESNTPSGRPASLKLTELEDWAIREALTQTGGNNTQAARLLGIHRDTLIAKLKKYGIDRAP